MPNWDQEYIEAKIAELTKQIELDPNEIELYFRRGSHYWSVGEWDLASRDIERTLEIAPTSAGALQSHGSLLLLRRQYDEAIEQFTKSLAIKKYAGTYVKRSEAYGRQDKSQEAISDLMSAMRMDPAIPSVVWATAFYHHWISKFDTAVKYYDRFLAATNDEEHPDRRNAYYYKSDCLCQLGRINDAIESCQMYLQRVNPRAVKRIRNVKRRIQELKLYLFL